MTNKRRPKRRHHEVHVEIGREGVLESDFVMRFFDPYLPEPLTETVLFTAVSVTGDLRLAQLSYRPIMAPLGDRSGHVHALVEGWPEDWTLDEWPATEPQVAYVFGDGRAVHYDCAMHWSLGREDATAEELLDALELVAH